jgi:hypothetical protein
VLRFSAVLLLLLTGCAPSWMDYELDIEPAEAALHGYDHRSTYGILELVNAVEVDVERLTGRGVDEAAAYAIVARRRGDDGLDGGWDDDFFDDLAELSALPEVDDVVLDDLMAAAWAWGYVPVVELEGVPLNQAQHDRLLQVANFGTFEGLDEFCALDVRAVRGIVDRRPYVSVFDLGDTPYVGSVAIGRLVDCAEDLVDTPELLED